MRDEDIALSFSRFKIDQVLSYGNNNGPMLLARYLNCVRLHLKYVRVRGARGLRRAKKEVYAGYLFLILTVLKTVFEEKNSFVITDEAVTAIITNTNFEILGDIGELPEDEQISWFFLKEAVVYFFIYYRKWPEEHATEKYPEVFNQLDIELRVCCIDNYQPFVFERDPDEYTAGPEVTMDRVHNAVSTGAGAVEHIGDNRDISKLTESRRMNGFGTVVVPPETNSSISGIGRRAPTFEVEGRTYRFTTLGNMELAFEVVDNGDKSTLKKKFTKTNRIKLDQGIAEVDRIIETQGDCESLSDLVEYYIHNSDDVWLLAALRIGAPFGRIHMHIRRSRWRPPLLGRAPYDCDEHC